MRLLPETANVDHPTSIRKLDHRLNVPLRLRLALIYGSLASLSLSMALVIGYGFYERAAFHNLDLSLTFVRQLAQTALVERGSFELPPIGLNLTVREYDAQGRLLRSSGTAPVSDAIVALSLAQPVHAAWIALLPSVGQVSANYAGFGLSVIGGQRWRITTVRLPDQRIVQLLFPLHQIDAALATVRINFSILALVGVLIVFALGYGLSGSSLQPLTRLARTAEGLVLDPRGSLEVSRYDPDLSPLEDTLKLVFERLGERERFVSGVLATTPSLVYVYDLEKRANTYVNDQLGPLLGYTHDQVHELDGQFVERLVHPDQRTATRSHLDRVRDSKQGTVLENEYQIRHADGSWRWFRSRDVVFEREASGTIKSILGIADDITEARQVQDRNGFLLRFDLAISQVRSPLEIETTATRLLGEHLGADRVLFARIDGETVRVDRDWSPDGTSIGGEFRRGQYFSVEVSAFYAAGQVRVIEDTSVEALVLEHAPTLAALGIAALVNVPLFGAAGWAGILGVHRAHPYRWTPNEIGIIRDVAVRAWPKLEQARANAELEVSRARLDAALESSQTGVWELDRKTDEIIYSGEFGPFHGFGFGPGRVAAATVRALTVPDDEAKNRPIFELALKTGGVFESEYRLQVAGRSERWVLSRGRVLGANAHGPTITGTLTDITDRKASEQRWREGEARYRALVEAGAQIVWRTDAHGVLKSPLERWSTMTGLAPEQLNQETLLTDWVHPDDLEPGSSEWHRAMLNGHPLEFEQRVRQVGGNHRFWAVRAAPVRDQDGRILEWIGTDTDITERRRDENRLRALYETTRALSEAATPEDVRRTALTRVVESAGANGGALRFVTDDGRALRLGEHLQGHHMNPDATLAFEVMPLGMEHPATEAARIAQPLFFSDASRLAERYPALNTSTSARNATQSCAHLPLRGDGRVLAMLTLNFVQPQAWDAAERDFVLTLGDQVSLALERSRLFETISRSEAQYRALVQSTTQFVWQRHGADHPESIRWWCDLTGQTPEESSGQGWLAALHADDRERAQSAWTEAFTNGTVFSTEYRVRSKSGRYVHLEVRGVPIPEPDGTVSEWVGTFNDVTSEREVVNRLREINEAQRRFVSDASHELRTPLTSIGGNLDLLIRYPDMSQQDRTEAITDAQAEARRMGRLIEDLLGAARGKSSADRLEAVRLEAVLGFAWRVASALSAQRQFELGTLEPALIVGDADQIKQLALILLENAVKYTPDGGMVRLSGRVTDGHAEFTVSDTGRGIAPKDAPHVFERFYRADLARTPGADPGGSGLGLTIAKKIAEDHGGSLSLESAPGVGSSFTVRLPLATEA